jgi:hypothetical protein
MAGVHVLSFTKLKVNLVTDARMTMNYEVLTSSAALT